MALVETVGCVQGPYFLSLPQPHHLSDTLHVTSYGSVTPPPKHFLPIPDTPPCAITYTIK